MQVVKRSSGSNRVDGFHKQYLLETPAIRASLLMVARGTDIIRHEHTHSNEIFVIIAGACTLSAGNRTEHLTPGDIAVVPASEAHYFRVDPEEDLILFAAVAPNLNDAIGYKTDG